MQRDGHRADALPGLGYRGQGELTGSDGWARALAVS
jgi:hypothetical protein